MKTKEKQIMFIGRQAEFERQLARLYALYEEKFPDFDLWPFLVEEEQKHEGWLKQIIPKIKSGSITFFLDDLRVQAINKAIEYINKEYEKVGKEDINLFRAVTVAQGIENSALENKIFDYFDSDSPSVDKILNDLKEDTKKHRDMLLKYVLAYQK